MSFLAFHVYIRDLLNNFVKIKIYVLHGTVKLVEEMEIKWFYMRM